MRPPREIFEEVLNAWDAAEFHHLDHLPERQRRAEVVKHLARVKAYREEFRAAMEPGGTVHGHIDTVERAPFLYSDDGDDYVAPEVTPAEEPGCIEPSDEVDAALDDVLYSDDHESVTDRSERLAERHVRFDGSERW